MAAARRVSFLEFVPVSIRAPLITCIAYWAGAQLAFLVGTLSDSIFAPFWPPNAILFCALLVACYADWWRYLIAVLPAHVIAELQVGMDVAPLIVAFLTNCALALLSAWAVRWLLANPPWLSSFRRALIFVIVTAGVGPALVAFGGAYVRILGEPLAADYWVFWLQWFLANALGNLTLTPVILAFFYSGVDELSLVWSSKRWIEVVLVSAAVLLTCVIAIEASIFWSASSILPALVYLPFPFVLWATVRFGVRGACLAVLILTLASIWANLSGPSLFSSSTREGNVMALQLFLTGLAAPLLLLGAYVGGARRTQHRSHELSRMALTSKEEYQRKMSEDLHEGVCQDLAAAYLKARFLFNLLPAETKSEAAEVEERILEAIGTLRAAAYGMYPPLLAEGGLEPALRSFIHTYSQRTGIAVALNLPLDIGRLDHDSENVAFRIVEEALTNVERHSGSTSALVSLSRNGESADELLLRIEDPAPSATRGTNILLWLRSFAPTSVASGLGIAAMTERLHAIGGRLQFHSLAGSTIVEAAFRGVPVRND
jgi:signal transduction histidine kinase